MVKTREVAKNIFLIDDELYSIPGHGAVYFLAEEKKALVDTGPASSAETVLRGIKQLGFKSEEVGYIIITHIHLDHGGGAGTLLKEMPQAKVMAHSRGVRHLINPSRLLVSAAAALGDETFSKIGEVLPIEAQRLTPAYDKDTLKLSDEQVLTFLECPGHAPHEICIFESRNRGVFVGDAVGHVVDGTEVMIPVTPPPSFDLELYFKTLDRLKKLNAFKIYFAHSGTSTQVQEKLKAAAKELRARDDIIAKAAADNKLDNAVERVVNHIFEGLEVVKKEMRDIYNYWATNDIPTSAAEHVRYYKRKHGMLDDRGA